LKENTSDIHEEFDRIAGLYQEFTNKLNSLFEDSRISSKELEKIMSSPKNFTPAQWSLIEREREKWDAKLWSQISEEAKRKELRKRGLKKSAPRRKKHLGRRRGWLDMR
jgi:hypothetical protein